MKYRPEQIELTPSAVITVNDGDVIAGIHYPGHDHPILIVLRRIQEVAPEIKVTSGGSTDVLIDALANFIKPRAEPEPQETDVPKTTHKPKRKTS